MKIDPFVLEVLRHSFYLNSENNNEVSFAKEIIINMAQKYLLTGSQWKSVAEKLTQTATPSFILEAIAPLYSALTSKEIKELLALDQWETQGDKEGAVQKIITAIQTGASSLNLSGHWLTSLPVSLGKIASLNFFDFSENYLTSINFYRFKQGTRMNLAFNPLLRYPPLDGYCNIEGISGDSSVQNKIFELFTDDEFADFSRRVEQIIIAHQTYIEKISGFDILDDVLTLAIASLDEDVVSEDSKMNGLEIEERAFFIDGFTVLLEKLEVIKKSEECPYQEEEIDEANRSVIENTLALSHPDWRNHLLNSPLRQYLYEQALRPVYERIPDNYKEEILQPAMILAFTRAVAVQALNFSPNTELYAFFLTRYFPDVPSNLRIVQILQFIENQINARVKIAAKMALELFVSADYDQAINGGGLTQRGMEISEDLKLKVEQLRQQRAIPIEQGPFLALVLRYWEEIVLPLSFSFGQGASIAKEGLQHVCSN